jgi:hypothetical protein
MTPMNRVPTTDSSVLAFEFSGRVESEDIETMANEVDDAYDRHDSISLILLFHDWQGAEVSATFDPDVVATQFKALSNVDRYAVVGAPDAAQSMIDVMDHVIPVDAETFEADEEEAAWSFIGARRAGDDGPGSTPSAVGGSLRNEGSVGSGAPGTREAPPAHRSDMTSPS